MMNSDIQKINKKELLKRWKGKKAIDVLPEVEGDIIICSDAQQSIWLHEAREGKTLYSMPIAYRVPVKFDGNLIKETLNILILRHEILRTIFFEQSGKIYQKVLPCIDVDVPVEDYSPRHDRLQQRLEALAKIPFDLLHGPLLRVYVFHMGSEASVILFHFHHIIADGWSLKQFTGEFSEIYDCLCHGKIETANTYRIILPIQYKNYAVWSYDLFIASQKHESFWQKVLFKSKELELPAPYKRPSIFTYRGNKVVVKIPDELSESLHRIMQATKLSTFIYGFTAFELLLFAYANQSDFNIGFPIANRQHYQTESLIGYFINILVCRCLIDTEVTLSQLLLSNHETLLQLYQHSEYPFLKLVEKLSVLRSHATSPLFQAMYIYQDLSVAKEAKLQMNFMDVDSSIALFDILLNMYTDNTGMYVSLTYYADLFDKNYIHHFLQDYFFIFQRVCELSWQNEKITECISPLAVKKIQIHIATHVYSVEIKHLLTTVLKDRLSLPMTIDTTDVVQCTQSILHPHQLPRNSLYFIYIEIHHENALTEFKSMIAVVLENIALFCSRSIHVFFVYYNLFTSKASFFQNTHEMFSVVSEQLSAMHTCQVQGLTFLEFDPQDLNQQNQAIALSRMYIHVILNWIDHAKKHLLINISSLLVTESVSPSIITQFISTVINKLCLSYLTVVCFYEKDWHREIIESQQSDAPIPIIFIKISESFSQSIAAYAHTLPVHEVCIIFSHITLWINLPCRTLILKQPDNLINTISSILACWSIRKQLLTHPSIAVQLNFADAIYTDLNLSQLIELFEDFDNICTQDLAEFNSHQQNSACHHVALTNTEMTLSALVKEVLHCPSVNMTDNFFQIGGQSLNAVNLVENIRKTFDVELSLRDFFNQSTFKHLAQWIEALSKRNISQIAKPPSVLPKKIPLSFTQHRIWFLDKLDPHGHAYNMPFLVQIDGHLDSTLLERSIEQLMRNHAVFRTRFVSDTADPYQVIDDFHGFYFKKHSYTRPLSKLAAEREVRRDLARRTGVYMPVHEDSSTKSTKQFSSAVEFGKRSIDLEEQDKWIYCNRLLDAEVHYKFDLSKGPLLRFHLIQFSASQFYFIFNVHHIIADGYTITLMMDEISQHYLDLLEGKEIDTGHILKREYAHYCVDVQYRQIDHQLEYWLHYLAPHVPLELIIDFPRPLIHQYNGAHEKFFFPASHMIPLRSFLAQKCASLFSGLFAAFMFLLKIFSDQNEIIVGIPATNRLDPDTQKMMGLFLNIFPIRERISGSMNYEQLLMSVNQSIRNAYANPDVPFEVLVDRLKLSRDLSRNPLVQVMFNFINIDKPRLKIPFLKTSFLEVERHSSKFDLDFFIEDVGGNLVGILEYNADIFSQTTIKQMLSIYTYLLETVFEHTQQTLSSILALYVEPSALISVREYGLDQVDIPTGDMVSTSQHPSDLIIQLSQTFIKLPETIALMSMDREVTYSTLYEQVINIAKVCIARYGQQHGRVVLMFMDNVSAIMSMLAVLYTGRTYIFIDPESSIHLVECIAKSADVLFMLTDLPASMLLQEYEHFFDITTVFQIATRRKRPRRRKRTVDVYDQRPDMTHDIAANLPPVFQDTCAYVLYTSGSTGTPKGVMQSHKNLFDHIKRYGDSIHVTRDDVILQLAQHGTDAGVMDSYVALLYGAKLLILDIKKTPIDKLFQKIIEAGVTVLHLTPTVFMFLFRHVTSEFKKKNQIRVVVFGGEEVNIELLDFYYQHFSPTCLFVNGYGPTECTTALQFQLCGKKIDNIRGHLSVPIGKPLPGIQVKLLDVEGYDTCIYGEIVICSENIAYGYLNDVTLNQQKFFQDDIGRRWYKTGDIVRLLDNGNYIYMGRTDAQVKIRGFRVDLLHVENTFIKHAMIQDVAVVMGAAKGVKQLVAYVVPEALFDETLLRRDLRKQLPDYAIPQYIVVKEVLPRTRTGKKDRQQLSQLMDWVQEASDLEHVEDENLSDIEWIVKISWEKVLGSPCRSVNTNFFDAGGHSLLLLELYQQLQSQLSMPFTLVDLYQFPTIHSFSQFISHKEQPIDAYHVAAASRATKRKDRRNKVGHGERLLII